MCYKNSKAHSLVSTFGLGFREVANTVGGACEDDEEQVPEVRCHT